jgi:hypothetical protein
MGTNYYTTEDPPCPCCGRGGERIHIGKSSSGWEFCFEAHEDRGLTSLAEWRAFLADRKIHDEYGREVSLSDLERMVEAKRGQWTSQTAPDSAWGPSRRDIEYADPEGYRFMAREFS